MKIQSENQVKNVLDTLFFVLEQYKWLIDSYVLDFYVENHWQRLPQSWQATFTSGNFDIRELSYLLGYEYGSKDQRRTVFPLSLLSLKSVSDILSISRKQSKTQENASSGLLENPKFRNLFTRHVKIKKRHEIDHMSSVCERLARKSRVHHIIDVGAGQGHLARVLAFKYGLRVCCVEKQDDLNAQARILDNQFLQFARKYLRDEDYKVLEAPHHLSFTISSDMDKNSLLDHLQNEIFHIKKDEDFSIGIIGLHPCGDLGPILLELFRNCPEVKFIAVVGCCYMKLTERGYPLSKHVKNQRCDKSKRIFLSYEAREVACHAAEMYQERLSQGLFDDLKIHAYRSALEKIIVKLSPQLKHSGLRSVKYRDCSSFPEYCEKAVSNLGITLPEDLGEELELTKEWKKVAIFYTLRLMLAPLIESVLLYDRLLFLQETTGDCESSELIAAFNPRISPRNHILIARK
ncbi:protein RRNAD1 [Sergentomyia squamirostris]